MTAAHCTEYMDASELMVIVAEHDLSVDDDNARTVEVRDIVQKKRVQLIICKGTVLKIALRFPALGILEEIINLHMSENQSCISTQFSLQFFLLNRAPGRSTSIPVMTTGPTEWTLPSLS